MRTIVGWVATALIEHVKMYTEKRACDRVYWLTHQDNLVSQQIYNKVVKKTGFIQYRAKLSCYI